MLPRVWLRTCAALRPVRLARVPPQPSIAATHTHIQTHGPDVFTAAVGCPPIIGKRCGCFCCCSKCHQPPEGSRQRPFTGVCSLPAVTQFWPVALFGNDSQGVLERIMQTTKNMRLSFVERCCISGINFVPVPVRLQYYPAASSPAPSGGSRLSFRFGASLLSCPLAATASTYQRVKDPQVNQAWANVGHH